MEEDIPCSLVPIASTGKMLNVETPTIDSVIHMGALMNSTDYWANGRTMENLDLAGMSVRDLRLLAIGEPSK